MGEAVPSGYLNPKFLCGLSCFPESLKLTWPRGLHRFFSTSEAAADLHLMSERLRRPHTHRGWPLTGGTH